MGTTVTTANRTVLTSVPSTIAGPSFTSAAHALPPQNSSNEKSTVGKYRNWRVEPYKSTLARAVAAKLQDMAPQTAAGNTIIPRAALRDHVWDVKKNQCNDMGYLKGYV